MHPPINRSVGVLAACSLTLAALAVPAGAAEPTPENTIKGSEDWVEQAYENTATGADLVPEQADVQGPFRTPFGTGSHKATISQSTVQTELYRTAAYDGTLLANVTRLEYSTLARHANDDGPLRQPTYLRLNVDNDGDGTRDASLFFYPANNDDQQPVANGKWQHWDVDSGRISVDGDSGPGQTETLATYAAAHPGSTLVNNADGKPEGGALALIVGGSSGGQSDPQNNGEYFTDRVIVGVDNVDTLYDFGPNTETAGATNDSTVDPDHLHGWYHQAYDNLNYLDSNQEFVHGPGTPPAGAGSLRMSLSNETNPDRVELFRTTNYDGTLVRDLRTLTYSTFVRAATGNATAQQPPYARISVDTDGNGSTDDTLFYYPANNGTVEQGTWQTWNAADGKWGVNGDRGPAATVTLADYVVAHPDAVIAKNADGDRPGGGLAFVVGGTGAATQMNGEYFLDAIKVAAVDKPTGTTRATDTYDLEPTAPTVSIGNAKVLEGNNGAQLSFPVTLSEAAGSDVTVEYSTSNGTAKAGKDYTAADGSVTIPAGETTGTIVVDVLSDKRRERDERLKLTATVPGYGHLGDGSAIGTILNDDTRVGIALVELRGNRVKVKVDTLPAASGDVVRIFRVDPGKTKKVYRGELNNLGRRQVTFDRAYKPGTEVSFFAKVRTEHGVYVSKTATRTIR